jgi:uncharacterized cupredoxin-like copper-binding protein
MTRARRLALAATTLAVLVAAPQAVADMSVTVTAKDYSFALSEKTSATGKVTFSVKNGGKQNHSFQIAGKKTAVLKPGQSAKLAVTLSKAGSYSYSSTVSGDAGKGMKGSFTAKDVSAGKKVFASTGCGACHTFKAAGTTGKVGPSLDKSKASRATIESVITKGKGTMPTYKGTLGSKQIDQVSDFVFEARAG